MMLAVGEHVGYWSFGPVVPEDLQKTQDTLVEEARRVVGHDPDRAMMMRQAYFATTELPDRRMDSQFREILSPFIQT